MPFHHRLSRCRVLASLGALATTAALPAPAFAADPYPLKIAVVPTEVAAQGYFASDAGYFTKHGLGADITPLQNGSAVISAVLSGNIELGYSNILSFTVAHDKGLPLQVLFGTDINGLAKPTTGLLCVIAASPLKTAKDLAGKVVGVSSLSNTNLYAVKNWIDKSGGDSQLSKYVELPISAMAQALEAGRVDAASVDAAVYAPEASKLRMIGNTYYSIAPGFIAGVWFGTASWITEHPAIAQSFVAAIREASIWANKNHDDALKIYSKYSHIPVADLQAIPFPPYVEKTQASDFQPVIDVAAKYGAIKAPFPAKDLLSVYAQ
jgi:NitT/TauT family transport system substrate-binding protein